MAVSLSFIPAGKSLGGGKNLGKLLGGGNGRMLGGGGGGLNDSMSSLGSTGFEDKKGGAAKSNERNLNSLVNLSCPCSHIVYETS